MTEAQTLARSIVHLVDAAEEATDDGKPWKLWEKALLATLELDGICSEATHRTFGAWLATWKPDCEIVPAPDGIE